MAALLDRILVGNTFLQSFVISLVGRCSFPSLIRTNCSQYLLLQDYKDLTLKQFQILILRREFKFTFWPNTHPFSQHSA